jgi:hypothetical protein
MANALMSLGDILFFSPFPGLDQMGFETVSREMSANVEAQPRLGRDDAIQFTGIGPEIISIHGRVFPYQFGGLSTLGQIREALRAGQPLDLVQFTNTFSEQSTTIDTSLTQTYAGSKVGKYFIKDFKKQNSLYTRDVVPMKIDFTLDLVLYGDDA